MNQLDERIKEYKKCLDLKDSLAEQTKENNKILERMEQEIAQIMIDEEKPDTTVDGYKYSLQEKTMYSKIGEDRLMGKGIDFLEVLREEGFGDLIVERVDPRTLNSAMNNLVEETGELPEALAECLNVYSQLKVQKRKANIAALNRAKKAHAETEGR